VEKRFKPTLYCVDNYQAYQQVIPEKKLLIGKTGTFTVECNNSNTRHWFRRFTRKSKVVSHSQYMVSLTLKIQAFLEFIWLHF
jgi:IS1 family transposase